jgi:hypothetical protein
MPFYRMYLIGPDDPSATRPVIVLLGVDSDAVLRATQMAKPDVCIEVWEDARLVCRIGSPIA